MKQRCIIILRLGLACLCIVMNVACSDTTLLEYPINDVCTIEVLADSVWEISIPVYLKVHVPWKKTLISAPVFYYPPEVLETKDLELEIRLLEDYIVVDHQKEPNAILAMIYLKDEFIYPHISNGSIEEEETYYDELEKIFSNMKVLLDDEKLKLVGYSRYSEENLQ